ncbi:MAG: cyclic nucleotide-binding domain-containing protein [Deltaproteobacteria bacterium]|nr:cyclic nucleotide-binding domain-containing protein [Deltaproteobacteria bacterium]MDQ3365744.1 cyclic nucleotide-binding domain-containing protein [Myxococcota bacterium]
MGPRAGELRTIPLFHGFGDDELASLGGLFSRVEIDPQKALFEVGEQATELYLLTEGEVVLDRPDDDLFRLHPPALIGELGALTGLPRSTRAVVTPGSTVWSLPARTIQTFFASNQELGVRFLVNLLGVVADKVHRDQSRMADMRRNLITTQKELKRLRELVLETVETPLSAPVHDTLDKLITHNRRVNYRVEPPASLAAQVRLDAGPVAVADISRTHVSLRDVPSPPAAGSWLTGVLALAGSEIPISGRVHRVSGNRLTIELDLLIDDYAAVLEGYLTRAQLLDVLV